MTPQLLDGRTATGPEEFEVTGFVPVEEGIVVSVVAVITGSEWATTVLVVVPLAGGEDTASVVVGRLI